MWIAELRYTQDEITEAAYRLADWLRAATRRAAHHKQEEHLRSEAREDIRKTHSRKNGWNMPATTAMLGDLSARRGQILGTDSSADLPGTRVRAVVPQSELHLYASALQSMTHGRAVFNRHFRGYEEMPPDAAQRVVNEVAKEQSDTQAH